MIPAIQEINFPSYATLSQANVSLQEMGERTITSQIKIDGDVVPSFDGWELRFRGERFILPVKEPQATKDNTSRNSVIDLTFQSWVVFQMRRYFFVSMSQIDAGTAIPDQYNASVSLPIEGFVQLFNKVLQYYFGDAIRMDLFGAGTPGLYSQEPVVVEINKTYIWDVLVKFYELFGYRWRIEYDSVSGAHVIKVNYTAPAITDHDFEYGYQGGLLRFERQVQDTNISNVLIGRGGEKNLPYRYFKLQDPNNTAFAADPDAIPELANIYFDRLRDANFRWYVRGWMQNENRDTSWDATHTFPTYTDADCPEPFLFAFHRGQTDEKFNPIEYVKDDDSIAKYGERWGAVEDDDDAYPTIQGREVSGLGRVDEIVDVSPIVTDDIHEASKAAATRIEVAGTKVVSVGFDPSSTSQQDLVSEPFTIPDGQTGRIEYSILSPYNGKSGESYPGNVVAIDTTAFNLRAVDEATGTEYPAQGLNPGTYRLKFTLKATNYSTNRQTYVTYGFNSLQLVLSSMDADAWKPTFDIWVKNIWQSEQLSGESDEEYARRVWEPILGDRAGNEAKVVFSTGFMSTSQDYEFVIASYPVKDRSKTITSGGVNYDSEWKITLRKSDAEFEATGLYIPNATTGGAPAAGDHFFFIGIDMPFQYVVWGEEFLNGALNTPVVNKTAALEKLADINPSWVIQLDKVRCNTHEGSEYGQHLADRLSAGATVNIRDARFTGGQVLTLYVQSINYVWNEPTDNNPYLVPDIEVVLSDKVVATEGTVTRVSNELEMVKTTYAKSADIEQVVRSIGNALFLKKTGESDRSASPTSFASAVNSADFRPGDFGGAGWGHYEDSEGNSVLEVDTVIARKDLRVNSLVANQVAYIGGKSIRSAASIQCTQVVEDDGYYYCYFDQKQGSVANLFLVGDFAMGQDFDENNAETRYYRMSVAGVGVDYIKLAKSGRDGLGAPMKGDTIVQYGHGSDASRQYVIVEDVIGGGYQRMLSGLNTVSASGKEYYFAGRQPNVGERWFVGDAAGEHAEWKNGQLNITGRVSVRDINGNYQAMDTYMSGVSQAITNLQAQIDGQIQSWASGEAPTPQTEPLPKIDGGTVDPSTANFPASGWANNTEREKHVGDIYVDDSTGQGYRYTKRLMNGVTEYYWTRITDEELAQALADIQALQQQYAGLVYLKNALEESTVVQGGLILSSLIQLGYTSGQTYTVMAGINGKPDQSLADQTRSIAAWYGGPMVDHEADPSAANYAKSLFRFDGSGYLAGGNIFWDKLGYGGIPGITWNGNDIIIGGNVKLASLTGDSVTELIGLVRDLSSLIEKVNIGTQANPVYAVHVKDGMGIYSDSFVDAGGIGSHGGGGGGADLAQVWSSLTNQSIEEEDITPTIKIATDHIPDLGMSKIAGLLEALGTKQDTISDLGTIRSNAAAGAAAYSWGNHANAGYLLASVAAETYATITSLDNLASLVEAGAVSASEQLASLASRLSSLEAWVENPTMGEAFIQLLNTEDLNGVRAFLSGELSVAGLATIFGGLLVSSTKRIYFGDTAHYLELTADGEFHFSHGVYSDDYMAAGGIGSHGGGGGGADLAQVWSSLTNQSIEEEDITPTIKIATDHIPDLGMSKIAGLLEALGTKQDTISDLGTIRSNAAAGAAAYSWGNHANAGYLLASVAAGTYATITSTLALAEEDATAAARLSSLESWFLHPELAELYTGILDTEEIDLSGLVLSGSSGGVFTMNGNPVFSSLANSGNQIAVTIGGQQRTLTVNFATNCTNAAAATNATYATNDASGRNIVSTYQTISEDLETQKSSAEGLGNLYARVASLEEWFARPSLGEAFIHQLDVEEIYGSNAYLYNRVYFAGKTAFIEWDASEEGLHFNTGIFSDAYMSAGGVSTSSDARLKKNLQDVKLTVDQIARARAVTFDWMDESKGSGAGTIAQDWEDLIPQNVHRWSGDMLSIEYGNIALISAIVIAREVKEQSELLKDVTRRIRRIEHQLNLS